MKAHWKLTNSVHGRTRNLLPGSNQCRVQVAIAQLRQITNWCLSIDRRRCIPKVEWGLWSETVAIQLGQTGMEANSLTLTRLWIMNNRRGIINSRHQK